MTVAADLALLEQPVELGDRLAGDYRELRAGIEQHLGWLGVSRALLICFT
ncbi:MAG: hypothetical protein M3Y88_04625 [Chloroflexota bacterium]|nr:hypothetical protein [Chloroflexota bacterium]